MLKVHGNEEGVSAAIGIMLMIAITVAIAATTYVYVSGMIGGAAIEGPSLELQVSPNGYPQLYEKWDIYVWKVNKNTRYIGNNVTILISVFNEEDEDNSTIYNITADNRGYQSFQYNEPKKHEFSASSKGFRSAFFCPDTNYINPIRIKLMKDFFTPITLLMMLAFLGTLIGIKISILPKKRKHKGYFEFEKKLLYASMVLSSIFILTIIIGIFLQIELDKSLTPYGYIENNLLSYLYWDFFIAIISLIFSLLLFLVQFNVISFTKKNKN